MNLSHEGKAGQRPTQKPDIQRIADRVARTGVIEPGDEPSIWHYVKWATCLLLGALPEDVVAEHRDRLRKLAPLLEPPPVAPPADTSGDLFSETWGKELPRCVRGLPRERWAQVLEAQLVARRADMARLSRQPSKRPPSNAAIRPAGTSRSAHVRGAANGTGDRGSTDGDDNSGDDEPPPRSKALVATGGGAL